MKKIIVALVFMFVVVPDTFAQSNVGMLNLNRYGSYGNARVSGTDLK